jgi:hypothetical protein
MRTCRFQISHVCGIKLSKTGKYICFYT